MQLDRAAAGIMRRTARVQRESALTSWEAAHKSVSRERFCRNFQLVHHPSPLDFSEYLPYLINRVGSALVIDFVQSTLAHATLSIAMWRVLAVLSNDGGQRQIDLAGKTSIDVSTFRAWSPGW
jgi:hypothetical protein